MISRRYFLKQMLAFLALLAGGVAGAARLLDEAPAPTAPIPGDPAVRPVEAAGLPLASVFLLSDIHVSAADAALGDKLHVALKDISTFESAVDAIVLGGDLTDFGRDIEYKQLRRILNQYKLPPLYANMGNHDYYDIWLTDRGGFSTETMPNGKTDAMSRERFMKFMGYEHQPYIDIWLKGIHLIMMSQETYVQEKKDVGEGAWYSDEQLAWLENTMKSHQNGKPALVFIHQPLPQPGSDGGSHTLIRARKFRSILQPYRNVFVFSGHTHRNFSEENHYNKQNTFHWFSNASVGKTRGGTPEKPAIQGMYIQVFEDKVVVRGREFSNRTWIDKASWTVPLPMPKRAGN